MPQELIWHPCKNFLHARYLCGDSVLNERASRVFMFRYILWSHRSARIDQVSTGGPGFTGLKFSLCR
jgi:hypothetical protein